MRLMKAENISSRISGGVSSKIAMGKPRQRKLRMAAAVVPLAGMMISQSVQAATDTWDGASGQDWSSSGNPPWNSAKPGSADTAVFNTTLSTVANAVADQSIGSISFDTSAGTPSGSFVIGTTGGNKFTLTTGGTIQILSTLSGTGETISINSPIVIGTGTTAQTYSFTNGVADSTDILTFGGQVSSGTTNTATLTLSGTNTGTNAISGNIINGSGTMVVDKSSAGTWVLSGADSYSGGTNIAAGTLGLSGGNDRLLNTGTVNFTGSSTLSLSGAISQTLSKITVANGVTGTVTGSTGTLTLNGTPITIGSSTTTASTLDLSGLGTFSYNNSSGTFKVGGLGTAANASAGTVKLATVSTITALSVGVGTTGWTSNSNDEGTGTLNLGTTATINANTITLGGTQAQGTIGYGVSTASPMLTIAASDGVSRANLTIGTGTDFTDTVTSSLNLSTNVTGTSTLNAMIGTLTIGNFGVRGTSPSATPVVTGSLLMEGGTLDATTIILGQMLTSTETGGNLLTANGTLTVTGGTVKVGTLSLGNQNNTSANSAVNGTFNLNGGANLYAQTIDKGTGTGTQTATRTFNWNAGTIHNYDASTDLTINSLASTGATSTFALLGAGAHTFNIDNGRQGTVAQIISSTGTSGLTKAGAGTLTLSAANTYSVATTITGGVLSTGSTGILAYGTLASSIGASSNLASKLVLDGGTLQYANTGAPESTDRLFTLTTNGGGLDASGTNAITFAGNGSGAANAIAYSGSGTRTLTLTGTNTSTNTLAPILANGTGGATSLSKTGIGVWALTGSNSYTGTTTVSAGTLRANNASALSSSNVTINSSGTLGGNGGGTGMVTVNSNGTITAGVDAATIGTLTSGAQAWTNGGIYAPKLADASASDLLVISSTVTLSSNPSDMFNINASAGTPLVNGANNQLWEIADIKGGLVNYTGTAPTSNTPIPVDSSQFALTVPSSIFSGGVQPAGSSFTLELASLGASEQGLYINYNATPEPGTAMLLLAGVLPMLTRRRRRVERPNA